MNGEAITVGVFACSLGKKCAPLKTSIPAESSERVRLLLTGTHRDISVLLRENDVARVSRSVSDC
jgi:hypothetical protein